MDETRIEIEGLYESKDFWRSYFAHYFNPGWLYFHFLTLVLYGLALTFLFLGSGYDSFHIGDVLLLAGLFVAAFALVMSFVSVGNAKAVAWGKFKYIVTTERMEVVSDSFTSYLEWSWFTRIKETKKYFILTSKYGQTSFLPKRFFRDTGEIAAFKNLISAQLGDKVYLKKSKETLGLK